MNPREMAVKTLEEKGEVAIRCNGNSMRPLIAPKELIHLFKVEPSVLKVGDAVFVKINGAYQVHKLTAIDGARYQISNNKGWVNGWVSANCIYGLCVQVEDRIVVSAEEMAKRAGK